MPFSEMAMEANAGAVALGEGAMEGAAAVALWVPLVQPFSKRKGQRLIVVAIVENVREF